MSAKKLEINFFFSGYIVRITESDNWVKFIFRRWDYKKFSNDMKKYQKRERNFETLFLTIL